MEVRVCRWCGEQKMCTYCEMDDMHGEIFTAPFCKKCILTSTEYSYARKNFENLKDKKNKRDKNGRS
jgi:hypothetical protein